MLLLSILSARQFVILTVKHEKIKKNALKKLFPASNFFSDHKHESIMTAALKKMTFRFTNMKQKTCIMSILFVYFHYIKCNT